MTTAPALKNLIAPGTPDDVRARYLSLERRAEGRDFGPLEEDVVVLDLTELSDVCDFFMIATGFNNRQVDTIVDEIEEQVAKACGEHPFSIEGRDQRTWILMDYGSVVVHVFTPEAREYYRLEKLWGDAPQLSLDLV